MKTKIFSILMVLVMTIMAIPGSVFAYTGDGSGGINGDGGASSIGILILDNKDTTTWQRIGDSDSKYGVFTYNTNGSIFAKELHLQGAVAGAAYHLIYFCNPYPGTGKRLWSGNAGGDGRIDVTSGFIEPSVNLPFSADPNRIAVPGINRTLTPDFYPSTMVTGAKIWLVPASCYDVSGQQLSSWTDTDKMFFETGLINYTYTTVPSGKSVGLTTTIIEPLVGISVTPPTIDFGNVMIGRDSSEFDIFITNTGNVPAKITTLVSDGFYRDCLWLKYPGGWVLAKDWSYTPLANGIYPAIGTPITVKAVVHPTAAYATATLMGSITFLAEMAP